MEHVLPWVQPHAIAADDTGIGTVKPSLPGVAIADPPALSPVAAVGPVPASPIFVAKSATVIVSPDAVILAVP